MKSTGVVRKIDELGRIVIPMEIRKTFGISAGDSLEMFVENENTIFRQYHPSCISCGNCDNVDFYLGKRICTECIGKIKEQF